MVQAIFSQDGKLLAHGPDIWYVATGDKPGFIGKTGNFALFAFSNDGQTLAMADDDASIKLWDLRTEKESNLR